MIDALAIKVIIYHLYRKYFKKYFMEDRGRQSNVSITNKRNAEYGDGKSCGIFPTNNTAFYFAIIIIVNSEND